jgi:hypothetical protein
MGWGPGNPEWHNYMDTQSMARDMRRMRERQEWCPTFSGDTWETWSAPPQTVSPRTIGKILLWLFIAAAVWGTLTGLFPGLTSLF